MDYENVLGERKFPTYEQLKTGLLRLIDEGKISREDASLLLPELRESEDETTRKELLDFVRSFWADHKEKIPQASRWLAYLEKQKEQNPLIKKGVKYYCIKAQKRRTDFHIYAFTVGTEYIAPENNVLIDNDGHSWDLTRQTPEWIFERFTPKDPKQEWSEEDEKVYNNALDALYYKDLNNKDDVLSALKDLCDLISMRRKIIPPYARYRPSEEQKEALQRAIDCLDNEYGNHPEELDSLLNDLNKL